MKTGATWNPPTSSTQFCFFFLTQFCCKYKTSLKTYFKILKSFSEKWSFKRKQPIWGTNWFQCMRLTWILIWTNYRRWGRRKGGEMPRYWMILRNYYNNLRGDKVLWLCLKNSSCPNTESWNVCIILWSLRFALKNFLVGEQVTKKHIKWFIDDGCGISSLCRFAGDQGSQGQVKGRNPASNLFLSCA